MVVQLIGRRRRRLASIIIVLAATPFAFAEEPTALAPRYAKGELIDVEGKFTLEMSLAMTVAKEGIARTTTELQASGHRYVDRVVDVAPNGEPRRVRRRFIEQWRALREPGARAPVRTAGPLDRRSLDVALDAKGRAVARPLEGAPPLEEGATDDQRVAERWDGALPPAGTATIGATWKVKGQELGALFFPALGEKPDGELEGRLVGVAQEKLEPTLAPEPVATIALTLRARRDDADGPKLEAELSGALKFAIDRKHVVSVQLKGEGRMEEEHGDPSGAVMLMRGRGPLEIEKRIRFPKEEPK